MRTVHTLLIAITTAVTSCYHLPTWHGDVVVHPLEREAIMKCGNGALTAEGKKRISREPYLQSTTTTSTIVAWGSTEGRGEVVLRTPDGDVVEAVPALYAGDDARKEARLKAQNPKDGTLEADDIYVVRAAFSKLEPNQLYCYEIVDNGVALTTPAPLTTAAEPGLVEPFRFVAVGDTGTGGDAEKAIAKRMSEVSFDMMLFLGDIAYESGTAKQLQNAFFKMYSDILRYVPAYPTIGNHERRTRKGAPYFDAFVLPQPERYYSFDWGDVHFAAIDTTHRDSEQIAWLKEDLAKTKQRWKIVFGHHPMYTNSLRGPQQWIRKAYAKIFTDNKVDFVLTGHEHQYERFRVGNVNYVVSGGGGGRLTRFFGMFYSLKRASRHHFLHFEATSLSLTMKVIDIDGREIETVHLTKEGEDNKAKVNNKPETKESPVAPEKSTVPDEKLHDEPDDDKHEDKLPPDVEGPRPPPPPNAEPPKPSAAGSATP